MTINPCSSSHHNVTSNQLLFSELLENPLFEKGSFLKVKDIMAKLKEMPHWKQAVVYVKGHIDLFSNSNPVEIYFEMNHVSMNNIEKLIPVLTLDHDYECTMTKDAYQIKIGCLTLTFGNTPFQEFSRDSSVNIVNQFSVEIRTVNKLVSIKPFSFTELKGGNEKEKFADAINILSSLNLGVDLIPQKFLVPVAFQPTQLTSNDLIEHWKTTFSKWESEIRTKEEMSSFLHILREIVQYAHALSPQDWNVEKLVNLYFGTLFNELKENEICSLKQYDLPFLPPHENAVKLLSLSVDPKEIEKGVSLAFHYIDFKTMSGRDDLRQQIHFTLPAFISQARFDQEKDWNMLFQMLKFGPFIKSTNHKTTHLYACEFILNEEKNALKKKVGDLIETWSKQIDEKDPRHLENSFALFTHYLTAYSPTQNEKTAALSFILEKVKSHPYREQLINRLIQFLLHEDPLDLPLILALMSKTIEFCKNGQQSQATTFELFNEVLASVSELPRDAELKYNDVISWLFFHKNLLEYPLKNHKEKGRKIVKQTHQLLQNLLNHISLLEFDPLLKYSHYLHTLFQTISNASLKNSVAVYNAQVMSSWISSKQNWKLDSLKKTKTSIAFLKFTKETDAQIYLSYAKTLASLEPKDTFEDNFGIVEEMSSIVSYCDQEGFPFDPQWIVPIMRACEIGLKNHFLTHVSNLYAIGKKHKVWVDHNSEYMQKFEMQISDLLLNINTNNILSLDGLKAMLAIASDFKGITVQTKKKIAEKLILNEKTFSLGIDYMIHHTIVDAEILKKIFKNANRQKYPSTLFTFILGNRKQFLANEFLFLPFASLAKNHQNDPVIIEFLFETILQGDQFDTSAISQIGAFLALIAKDRAEKKIDHYIAEIVSKQIDISLTRQAFELLHKEDKPKFVPQYASYLVSKDAMTKSDLPFLISTLNTDEKAVCKLLDFCIKNYMQDKAWELFQIVCNNNWEAIRDYLKKLRKANFKTCDSSHLYPIIMNKKIDVKDPEIREIFIEGVTTFIENDSKKSSYNRIFEYLSLQEESEQIELLETMMKASQANNSKLKAVELFDIYSPALEITKKSKLKSHFLQLALKSKDNIKAIEFVVNENVLPNNLTTNRKEYLDFLLSCYLNSHAQKHHPEQMKLRLKEVVAFTKESNVIKDPHFSSYAVPLTILLGLDDPSDLTLPESMGNACMSMDKKFLSNYLIFIDERYQLFQRDSEITGLLNLPLKWLKGTDTTQSPEREQMFFIMISHISLSYKYSEELTDFCFKHIGYSLEPVVSFKMLCALSYRFNDLSHLKKCQNLLETTFTDHSNYPEMYIYFAAAMFKNIEKLNLDEIQQFVNKFEELFKHVEKKSMMITSDQIMGLYNLASLSLLEHFLFSPTKFQDFNKFQEIMKKLSDIFLCNENVKRFSNILVDEVMHAVLLKTNPKNVEDILSNLFLFVCNIQDLVEMFTINEIPIEERKIKEEKIRTGMSSIDKDNINETTKYFTCFYKSIYQLIIRNDLEEAKILLESIKFSRIPKKYHQATLLNSLQYLLGFYLRSNDTKKQNFAYNFLLHFNEKFSKELSAIESGYLVVNCVNYLLKKPDTQNLKMAAELIVSVFNSNIPEQSVASVIRSFYLHIQQYLESNQTSERSNVALLLAMLHKIATKKGITRHLEILAELEMLMQKYDVKEMPD